MLLAAAVLVPLCLALLAWAGLSGPARSAAVATLAVAAAAVVGSLVRRARRDPAYFGPPTWGWRGRAFTWLAVSLAYLSGDAVRFLLGEDGEALRIALVVWALAGSAAWWLGRRLDPWLRGGASTAGPAPGAAEEPALEEPSRR